jgi:NitT/TauT family transport system permease protein
MVTESRVVVEDQNVRVNHTRTRRRRVLRSLREVGMGIFYPLVSLAAVVIAWKLVQVGMDTKTYLLPSPELVGETAFDRRELLWEHMLVTLKEVLYGFAMAVAVAIPLAVVMASSRIIEKLLYPVLVASQGIPKSALAPIFVIWLGFGDWPKIVIAMLISFFPIVVATFVGLRSVKPEMIDLGRSIGLNSLQMLVKIRFPSALPSVFGGLKVGISLAVVGAIVGEFVAADSGLGYLLILTTGQLRTELMFAALIYLSVMGVILFSIVDLVERLVIPWYHEQQKDLHIGG